MKAFKGWLTAKDPETKTEVPFFVRVRSQDIEVLNPIKIDKYLIKTSNDYEEILNQHFTDFSLYRYKINGLIDENINTQRYLSGYVEYKLYRDGSFTIVGAVTSGRISSVQLREGDYDYISGTNSLFNSSLGLIRIPLPYGIDRDLTTFISSQKVPYKYMDIKCYNTAKGDSYDRVPVASAFLPSIPSDPDIALRIGDKKIYHEIVVNPSTAASNYDWVTRFKIESQLADTL